MGLNWNGIGYSGFFCSGNGIGWVLGFGMNLDLERGDLGCFNMVVLDVVICL